MTLLLGTGMDTVWPRLTGRCACAGSAFSAGGWRAVYCQFGENTGVRYRQRIGFCHRKPKKDCHLEEKKLQ